MKNISTRKLLSGTFTILALLVLLVSLLALRSLNAADHRFSSYVAGIAHRKALTAEIGIAASRRAIGVREMVLVQSAAERDRAKAMAVDSNEKLQSALKQLKKALDTESDVTQRERAIFEKMEKTEREYLPIALSIVELAAAGKREEAIERMNTACRPLLLQLLLASVEYADYNAEISQKDVEASAAAYSRQLTLLLALSCFAVLAAVALGVFIARRLFSALGGEPAMLSVAAHRAACWHPWSPCGASWSR